MPHNVIGKKLLTVSSFVDRARGSIFIATSEKSFVPTIHQNPSFIHRPECFRLNIKKQTQVKYISDENRFLFLWIHNDLCSQFIGIKNKKMIGNTNCKICPDM